MSNLILTTSKGLSATDTKTDTLSRITQLSRHGNKYPCMKLPKNFQAFLGNVPLLTQSNIFIEGGPGCGKSTFALILASTLAKHGKLLYHSTEEGPDSATFKERIMLAGNSQMRGIESIKRRDKNIAEKRPFLPPHTTFRYFDNVSNVGETITRLEDYAKRFHPDFADNNGDVAQMLAVMDEYNTLLKWWNESNTEKQSSIAEEAIHLQPDVTDLRNALSTGKYRFVVMDSVNMYDTTKDSELIPIIKEFPRVNFICVAQHTKEGNYRGTGSWGHVVDAWLKARKVEAKESQMQYDWQGNEVWVKEGEIMRIMFNEKNRLSPTQPEFFIFKNSF